MLSLSLVGPCVILFLVYKYLIYPAFLSPLSKIPNAHPTSPFSPFWILWKRYSEQENRSIHAAHERHGDIVRLGPNEVSVACVDEGIRTIYSGGFEKPAWYGNQFENYGVPNMFSMTASKAHSRQKRMISNVYSKSYLQSSPEVHKISQTIIFDRLLPLLDDAAARKEPLDVLELNYATTMDFIIAFIFGLQNCSNFLLNAKVRKHWLAVYSSRRPYQFWMGEAPGFHTFLRKLGIYLVPKKSDEATSEIEAWTLEKCKAAQSSLTNPPSPPPPHQTTPIVYAQLTSAIPKSPTPPDLHTASELLDHLAAGHETSGITLTYLMHQLSLHPHLQPLLRSECLTLPPNPHPRDLSTLPLLHALLLETLRLHPPIAGPQPRTTPPTGTILATHALPPGVRVSSQAYTLHRNPHVFPSPETWDPERWLTASEAQKAEAQKAEAQKAEAQKAEAQKAEMQRWFWAFGSGGRMCVGSHFAMLEMKGIVAAVYARFETRVVDDGGVEQGDGYTVGPRGGRLVLGFERVG